MCPARTTDAMNATDRHRVTLVALFTVVALPSLWVLGRQQVSTSGAPTSGAAGVAEPSPGAGRSLPVTTYHPEPPIFLDPARDATAGKPVARPAPLLTSAPVRSVALVDQTSHRAEGKATFHYYPSLAARPCTTSAAPAGATITVVNVNNGQATSCRNTPSTVVPVGTLIVVSVELFVQIADLADAPISVRLSW